MEGADRFDLARVEVDGPAAGEGEPDGTEAGEGTALVAELDAIALVDLGLRAIPGWKGVFECHYQRRSDRSIRSPG